MRHILIVSLLLGFSTPSLAQYAEEDEGLGYDAIIQKLTRAEAPVEQEDTLLDDVKIHVGVGLANALYSIRHGNGDSTYAAQRGVEIALGIDLFSKYWIAEGSFRNYGQQKFENATVGLKEFDLKMIHRNQLSQGWGYRLGGGIAARYLSMEYQGPGLKYSGEYQTPASVVQGGIESLLTKRFSLGADLSWKSALIEETPDRSSYEVVVRLAGHF